MLVTCNALLFTVFDQSELLLVAMDDMFVVYVDIKRWHSLPVINLSYVPKGIN